MMDWTDRHCRYFLRGFSPSVRLYTEMLHANAVVHGDRARLLGFHPEEHPLALQLGGSDPATLAAAARIGEDFGYDEINLNCGCPSDKVQKGEFGACLMREPARVADCVAAMRSAVRLPVTVKMRIGTVDGHAADRGERMRSFDERDFADLSAFAAAMVQAGCKDLIVHARKAVLGRFSPKDNREVPPLRYAVVGRLRKNFPEARFTLNGGLKTPAQIIGALAIAGRAMLGREAYHNPMLLATLGQQLSGEAPVDNEALLERMVVYTSAEQRRGVRLSAITRHLLGWFTGTAGSREFRRLLSEGARSPEAGPDIIWQAAAQVLPLPRATPPLRTPLSTG